MKIVDSDREGKTTMAERVKGKSNGKTVIETTVECGEIPIHM